MRNLIEVFCAGLLVLLTGCSTLYERMDASLAPEQHAYEREQTHFHEVLDELGPPSRLTALPDGFAFIYESLFIREFQVGIGGREGWWQLLKMSFADSLLYRRSLILHFNDEGILLAHGAVKSEESLGKSGAIQPLLSLAQIVDTGAYEDDAVESLNWGQTMLAPLPVAMNREQDINSGAAGLEQSGASQKVGQRTLEMR